MPTEVGTRIGVNNSLDLLYSTALISGGTPVGWGQTCYRHEIAAAGVALDGGALYYETEQTDGLPSTTGYQMDVEIIIASTNIADGAAISMAVSKEDAATDFDDPLTPIATRLYFMRVGANRIWVFVIDSGADEFIWQWVGNITLGRVYKHHVEYDIQNKIIEWRVDGVRQGIRALLPANSQTISSKIFGSSGSSDGRETVWYTGKWVWTPNVTPQPDRFRPRIFAPGIAR